MLERPDVATLPADDAAFQIIRRNLDGRNGILDGVFGSDSLHSLAEDGTRRFVSFRFRTRLRIANDLSALDCNLIFEGIEKLSLRFFGSHARNAFKALVDLFFGLLEHALSLLDLTLHRRNLVLTLVERIRTTIERFLALLNTMLSFTHLALTLFSLRFDFSLKL